jgi:hypothetical protein
MTGFDIELVEAIGKKLDRPIQWTNVDLRADPQPDSGSRILRYRQFISLLSVSRW